ncbi:NAD(P)H-dependent oxidoreductase [Exiguobacterium sp. FSL W8-0210]|uniref:flavodoxin family protein n=1 Tax=Exiguobacterium sp. FSL W8-0210 TaxID=2921598 RepID=UPI0030F7A739
MPIGDDYRRIVEEMLEHDDILFITPIYWYSMSTKMKLFIDRFSESLRDEELDFKSRMAGKRFHLIAVGGDNPRVKGQALVTQFEHIASFLDATLETAILAEGNAPGEVEYDQEAVAAIAAFREKMSGARV